MVKKILTLPKLNNNAVKQRFLMKGYKYRGGVGLLDKDGNSIFERDINTIVANKVYLPTKKELNDPTEGFYNDDAITSSLEVFNSYSDEVKKHYNGLLEKLNNVGVYSLSKNFANELLWAYYASGHTGFAIEYDIEKMKESLNFNRYFQEMYDFDVNYVDNLPKADISLLKGKDFKSILKTYIGSKSKVWEHEDEYRLIFDKKGLFEIDYKSVTGIYFGCRMNESVIDSIMEKLKGRGLNYYKMELIGNINI